MFACLLFSFGILCLFFVAFALKEWLFWVRNRQRAPGGFEVKLMQQTGATPETLRKDNDHG